MPDTYIAIRELADEFGWPTRQLFPDYKRLKYRVYHDRGEKGWSLASDMAEDRQHVQPIVDKIAELGLTRIYIHLLARGRAPVKGDKPLADNDLKTVLTAQPRYMIEAAYRAVRLRGKVNNPATVIHG